MIRVNRKKLQNALKTVGRVLDKPDNPLFVSTEEDGISIRGISHNSTIKYYIPAKIVDDSEFTIQFKLFNNIINSVNTEEIDLASNDKTLTCIADSTEYTLATSEFIQVETDSLEPENELTLNSIIIKDAVRKVIPFVDNTGTKHVLSGVFLDIQEDKIKFVATDANRLAIKSISYECPVKQSAIVPAKALQVIEDVQDTEIKLCLAEDKFWVTSQDFVLITSLLSGKYPDYSKVIPESYTTRLQLPKHDLEGALKHIYPAVDKDKTIKISVRNKEVVLGARSINAIAYETVNFISLEGNDIEVLVDFDYLRDVLQVTYSPAINLMFIDEHSPILVTLENDPDYIYIFMPMRED